MQRLRLAERHDDRLAVLRADQVIERQALRTRDEIVALRQAARELLLAQNSDWAFIMKSGTVVEYARERTRSHLRRFNRLYQDLLAGTLDERWVGQVEALDNLFPALDYRIYARRRPAARSCGASTCS